MLVYKNAFNQIVINYKGILDSESSVEVYNTVGQKLISKHLKENITSLDAQLKSGVYNVKILLAGKSTTKKVVL